MEDAQMDLPQEDMDTGIKRLRMEKARSTRSMDFPPDFRRTDKPSPTSSGYSSKRTSLMAFSTKEAGRGGICDICSENMAVKACLTCSASYCDIHVRDHYRMSKLQEHPLVDLAEEAEQQRLCPEHHRPLEVFCWTDQTLICSMCSVTKHRGHDISHKTGQSGGKTFDGGRSSSTEVLPPPGEISFLSVKANSVTLTWGPPKGMEGPKKFIVTWECDGQQISLKVKDMYRFDVTRLQPGQRYEFYVATEGEHANRSEWVFSAVTTVVPPPPEIQIDQREATFFNLCWSKAQGMEHVPQHFFISYSSHGVEPLAIHTEDCYTTLTDLKPATQYTVGVSTVLSNGEQSDPVFTDIFTAFLPQVQPIVDSLDTTLATVSWKQPDGLEQIQLQYQISYQCPGRDQHITTTSSLSMTLSDLKPASEYTVTVHYLLNNGQKSQPVSVIFTTRSCLKELLSKAGLEDHYENKLTLSTVLELNANTTLDEPLTNIQSLPMAFLNRLMGVHVNARSVKSVTSQDISCLGQDGRAKLENSNALNPLDLTAAMFLCSDGFLQQEMVLKMSMCQFAVPLILPKCDTQQSTLMLWSLRDLVKRFIPRQADSACLTENRVVLSDIPMVSFVRLGERRLSKSHILNRLLSNPQHCHDTFVHENMECGDVPRRISDGLVEISWYLPCGNRNIDMFQKSVAVANLRGDIRSFETQFSFLCEVSAAVYIFCSDSEVDVNVLKGKKTKADLFLVVDSQRSTCTDTEKELVNPTNVIFKEKQNEAGFVRMLKASVDNITEKSHNNLTVEDMANVARQFGILIDEDNVDCQRGKKNAERITNNITDTVKFKEKQLPLQGRIWKDRSDLKKEECEMTQLETEKKQLREKQQSRDITDAMKNFLQGMSSAGVERSYFFKWMRIHLDNLSRQNLSNLRERYKSLHHSPEKKEYIVDLDRRISDCSLGLEHFLRELGQLYESACCLPENSPQRKQMECLPRLCAEMMLDGFPIELVDGHASNIPLRWISDVLASLHTLVQTNSKIKVVSVLGVQNTGKSTLLSTMFGVQFAVSSGFNTRRAFMHLIKVNKELKEDLECDFIMVIDTEGLKDPELAQLEDSYGRDNELATLVIGLSDVTIFNIAMENSTDMKDILQIALHAFIRMEKVQEMGKKPICHFVHQNVSDMSASEKNVRERKAMLAELDNVTRTAAAMEKKENITKFTDVMEYDPDTKDSYIPGLWHGNPPMAPVNAGYSEAVYDFKKRLMEDLKKIKKTDNLTDFMIWTETLWRMVRCETYTFSFRNSIVADAYSRLCTSYNHWEMSFTGTMDAWVETSQDKIKNFAMTNPHSQEAINNLLEDLMSEASEKFSRGAHEIHEGLFKDFANIAKQDVRKYREEVFTRLDTLKRETEDIVKTQLQGAAINGRVQALLQNRRLRREESSSLFHS